MWNCCKVLQAAGQAAQQSKRRQIDGAIVLAAIVGDGKSPAAGLLEAHGLTFEDAIKALQKAKAQARTKQFASTPAPAPTEPPAAAPVAARPSLSAVAEAAGAQSAGTGQSADEILAAARVRIQQRAATTAPQAGESVHCPRRRSPAGQGAVRSRAAGSQPGGNAAPVELGVADPVIASLRRSGPSRGGRGRRRAAGRIGPAIPSRGSPNHRRRSAATELAANAHGTPAAATAAAFPAARPATRQRAAGVAPAAAADLRRPTGTGAARPAGPATGPSRACTLARPVRARRTATTDRRQRRRAGRAPPRGRRRVGTAAALRPACGRGPGRTGTPGGDHPAPHAPRRARNRAGAHLPRQDRRPDPPAAQRARHRLSPRRLPREVALRPAESARRGLLDRARNRRRRSG